MPRELNIPMKRMNALIEGKVVGIEQTRNGKTFLVVYDTGETVKVYLDEGTKLKPYQEALTNQTAVKVRVQVSSVDLYVREVV